MKALKTVTTRGLIAGGLFAAGVALSAPVLADDNSRRGAFDSSRDYNSARFDRRYDSRYDSSYKRSRHTSDRRYADARPVTLRLRYDANGDGSIRLRRMLRNQHGIDSNDWRIRSVNIRNKTRRASCADLSVGGRSTGPVNLRRGITTIVAPRGRHDGRWVLNFENAKVRDVAVVLEPRNNRHATYRGLERSHKRDLSRHDDYAYRGTRFRNQRGLSLSITSR